MTIPKTKKWVIQERYFHRKLMDDEFKKLLDLKFIMNLGYDLSGRPIFYFCIRRFLPSQIPADMIAVFNGVFVRHYLEL